MTAKPCLTFSRRKKRKKKEERKKKEKIEEDISLSNMDGMKQKWQNGMECHKNGMRCHPVQSWL